MHKLPNNTLRAGYMVRLAMAAAIVLPWAAAAAEYTVTIPDFTVEVPDGTVNIPEPRIGMQTHFGLWGMETPPETLGNEGDVAWSVDSEQKPLKVWKRTGGAWQEQVDFTDGLPPPPPEPTGLVAHYTFDEGTGAVAADVTGHGYTAAISGGVTWATGQVNGAVQLDGTDGFLDVPDTEDTFARRNQAWSVNLLVNATGPNGNRVLSKGGSAGTLWALALGTSTTGMNDGTWRSVPVGSLDGAWTMLTWVCDGISSCEVYKNSTSVGTYAYDSDYTSTAVGQPLRIGRANNLGSPEYFSGAVDELRIYDIALTAAEIEELYGDAFPPPPPVADHTISNDNGLIQAEAYREGNEGVGYHDTTAGNSFIAMNEAGTCDRGDDVDIKEVAGEGCTVGLTEAGEYLVFDVDVVDTGDYFAQLRVANGEVTAKFLHIEIDNVDVTGPVQVPSLGNWNTQSNINSPSIPLTAGIKEIKVVFDAGPVDLNWVNFQAGEAPPPPPPPPQEFVCGAVPVTGFVSVTPASVPSSFSANTKYVFQPGTYQRLTITVPDGGEFYMKDGVVFNGMGETTRAFTGTPDGFKICGGEYTNYRGVYQRGVFHLTGNAGLPPRSNNGIIENVDVHDNFQAVGVFLGDNTVMKNSRVADNGRMGLAASRGENTTFDNVVVHHNGWNNPEGWGNEGGGSKFARTKNVRVINSTFTDNRGPGIWYDIENENALIADNVVHGNTGMGIFWELNWGPAVITRNHVYQNGIQDTCGWTWRCANITPNPSVVDQVRFPGGRIEISHNLMEGGRHCVTSNPDSRLTTGNLYVHHNVCRNSGLMGISKGGSPQEADYGTISFENNCYEGYTTGETIFRWANSVLNFSGWQARGNDTSGAFNPPGGCANPF